MASPDLVRIERALVSVSDKTGLAGLGRALAGLGVEILSTGGSAKALTDAGVAVTEVATATGFPEIMDGRVKTLHPAIHGGLLARRDDATHRSQMQAHGIRPIDLLVVSLYPFERTVRAGAGFDDCVENIDIGGPAMIRAAAKNHDFVAVIVDPASYAEFLAELTANAGATTLALRRRLAAAAYAHTAAYDAAISGWLAGQLGEAFPERIALAGERRQLLRYGENPHQAAALYVGGEPRPGVATAEQIQGKELSYNNLNDTDAAYELVAEFAEPAVAIVKHANPCGVAIGRDVGEAWRRALAADPVSAFGGIVAVNRSLDAATAEEIATIFTEVIIAPTVEPGAREVLARKKALRVLAAGGLPEPTAPGHIFRSLAGGFLVQDRDVGRLGANDLATATRRAATAAELADLLFAWRVCKHVKSNAIVLARGGRTVGIGAGQMSRVDSARLAVDKAAEFARAAGEPESRAKGAVAASDAFFPFPDGLLVLADGGVTAVIHPGGSKKDDEVTAAADSHGLALVLSGMRHFRH